MKISKKNMEFLRENLHETRAQYYINFFEKMSEEEFKDRIKKYCKIAYENEKTYFLGKLDIDSLVLLIVMKVIELSLKKKRFNLSNHGDVSVYASQKEIREEREIYENICLQIQKAQADYSAVENKLYDSINIHFSKEISILLEPTNNLLKTPANFKLGIAGYDFTFYEEDVYIINWHPMSGD